MVPVYRLKPQAPKAYFMDFACGCEDFALNYLGKYYQDTEFFHDIFHGYSHKCSQRYNSRRLQTLRAINTSIMEQVDCRFITPCASERETFSHVRLARLVDLRRSIPFFSRCEDFSSPQQQR